MPGGTPGRVVSWYVESAAGGLAFYTLWCAALRIGLKRLFCCSGSENSESAYFHMTLPTYTGRFTFPVLVFSWRLWYVLYRLRTSGKLSVCIEPSNILYSSPITCLVTGSIFCLNRFFICLNNSSSVGASIWQSGGVYSFGSGKSGILERS